MSSHLRAIRQAALQCARSEARRRLAKALTLWLVKLLFNALVPDVMQNFLSRVSGLASNESGDFTEKFIGGLFCGEDVKNLIWNATKQITDTALSAFGAGGLAKATGTLGSMVRFQVHIDNCGVTSMDKMSLQRVCSDLNADWPQPNPVEHGSAIDVLVGGVIPVEIKKGPLFKWYQLLRNCRFAAREESHVAFQLMGDWPPVASEQYKAHSWNAIARRLMRNCMTPFEEATYAKVRYSKTGILVSRGERTVDACTPPPDSEFGTALIMLGWDQKKGSRGRIRYVLPRFEKGAVCKAAADVLDADWGDDD